jgi:gamma-glutamyltranspeptidase/glutathione hydrolase
MHEEDMKMRPLAVALLLLSVCAANAQDAAPPAIPPLGMALHYPNAGRHGMAAAEERLAAKVGADILEQGGNAVDAAAAVGFALAVTYPAAGNLGGGGFMLIRLQGGKTVALDYRETAPAAATRDMYLAKDGTVDLEKIWHGHAASGVPGTVAGLLHAQERYGKLSRKEVLAPAIRLAEKGYRLHYFNAVTLETERKHLSRNAASRKEFFKPDGGAYMPGEIVRRRDLARTLRAISKHGRDGFYKGAVADAIADDMAANGGLITREDLANYKPVEREAMTGSYKGYDIIAFPPPSSGGPVLLQVLNILEAKGAKRDSESARDEHVLAGAMQLAYADRAELMGDPDFVEAPIERLISKEYARERAGLIGARATPSDKISAGAGQIADGQHTTHYSVVDADGNIVANTYTLNLAFGSGVVIPGTGIVMNNEMDDFAAAPGVPNAFGLVGGAANAIAPGKRPLSSMSPTLLLKDGKPVLALGAQGGSKIITAVIETVLNVADHDMNLAEAIAEPRIHHQWKPDVLLLEPGISADTRADLASMGHKLAPFDWHASVVAVMAKDGWFYGYSDERIPGGAACAPFAGC